METARTAWRDNAKGIGITLVVFGHAVRGLVAAKVIDLNAWHPIDFTLYTFHMPLFMFLAGISVPRSLEKGVARFVKSKILTVAYPYFVWSLIQFVIMFILSGILSGAHSHDSLLDLLWRPISPYWFLYALFVFLVVTAFIGIRFAIVMAVVAFPFGELFDKDALVHQLLHFALFFAAGMTCARTGRLIVPRVIALSGLAIAIVTVSLALGHHFTNYNSALIAPAAFGAGAFVIWLTQRLGDGWLASLGRLSYSIYVMHVLGTASVVILMTHILHVPHIAALYVTVDTAAGIVLPVAAYYVFRQIDVLPWLGLAVGAKGQRWIALRRGAAPGRVTASGAPSAPRESQGQS